MLISLRLSLSLSLSLALSLFLSGACHEDVAASASRRHAGLSIARRLAVARPKYMSGRRSSSTVLSQVCLGLPVLRRQSLGGPRMQAGELGSGLDQCRHGTDDQRRTSAVDG